MKLYKTLLALLILFFALAIIMGLFQGDFFVEAQAIYSLVWGKITLLDLYMGFMIFSLLILKLEQSWLKSLLWIVLLFGLGNIIALLYILKSFEKLQQLLKKEEICL